MRRQPNQEDPRIAIVGVGCRFPHNNNHPQALWNLLCEARHVIEPALRERYPEAKQPLLGGYLANFDAMDAPFFGLTAREAAAMDPQQRLLMEVAWEALEDARIPPSSLQGTRTSV